MNLDICEKDRQIIENGDGSKIFYQQCLQELELMKNTKFYNNASVFVVLMGISNNFDEMLPIYFSWLKKRFYAAVEEQNLRKSAAISLSNIFSFNDPYHSVIQKILSDMGNNDSKFLEM